MVTGNYEVIKSVNISLVLAALRRHQELSRADLARVTGLTTGTITNIVNKLLEHGFVKEKGSVRSSSGGRKPILLELDAEGGYAVGIEIRPTGIKAILVNLLAEPLVTLEKPGAFRYAQGLELITEVVENFQQSLGPAREKLLGIGVSVPGWVDFAMGKIHDLPNLPGWENAYLKNDLAKTLSAPAFVDNDANLAAQGELWFGQGKGFGQLIYVLVDDGVGAGFVFNHQVYRGKGYSVGELGHISFGGGEDICRCGKTGCLETAASGQAIETKYQRLTGETLTAEEIKQRLLAGEEQARQVFHEAADALGRGIGALINLYGPEAIILGGRVFRQNQDFAALVKEAALKYSLPVMSRDVCIGVSQLKEDSSIFGAAGVVFQSVLQPYSLHTSS